MSEWKDLANEQPNKRKEYLAWQPETTANGPCDRGTLLDSQVEREKILQLIPYLSLDAIAGAAEMKTRTPVWAINYQNQMDDFFAEMKRNNERNLEPETESEADRKFIESMDKIRETNANVKKRFSLEGVIAFLAVAAIVMLLTYWAVEGF